MRISKFILVSKPLSISTLGYISALLAIVSLFSFSQILPANSTGSSELGFSSISPSGTSGGSIIPASCESGYSHDMYCETFIFYADSNTVPYGGNTTLRWSTSGDTTQFCQASGGWSGDKDRYSGSEGTGALYSSQTYFLTCQYFYFSRNGENSWQTSETKSVTVNVTPLPPPPTVELNFQ